MTNPGWFVAVALSFVLSGSPAALAAVEKNDVIILLANSKRLQLNSPNSSLRQAMARFLQNISGDNRIALLTFNEHTSLVFPFTPVEAQAVETLLEPLDRIQPEGRYSNSAAAMERAIVEFNNRSRRKVRKSIVFITDNRINTGDKTRDLKFSRWLSEVLGAEAAAAGIRVHGVAFSETADVQSIEALAQTTGGHYERALRESDLQIAFERLSTAIINRRPPGEPSRLTYASQALLESEYPSRAETITVATQQEFAPSAAAQYSEPHSKGSEPSLYTQSDLHDTPPGATGIDKLMSQIPSIHLVNAWVSSNLTLLTASISALVAIVLGVFLVLKHRKGRSNLTQKRCSSANTVSPAQLEDVSGITSQGVYDISGKLTRIRRAPANDSDRVKSIIISDHLISRDHALIEYENYGYWISDRSSANGTFVNGEKITDKKLLKYGDRIRFAKHEFKFVMPPQAAMPATVALTSIPDERHPTQSDKATLAAAGSPPPAESDSTPVPWDKDEHRPGVRTPPLSSNSLQDYEPAAAGSSDKRGETAESLTLSPGDIQKMPKKTPNMDTFATPFETDDRSTDAETNYVSGGTAKLSEYHQGDTVMFRRSVDKKDMDIVHQDDESAATLGKTDSTEVAGEASAKSEYRRGGTELYRQPEHEAPMDFGAYRHQPELEGNHTVDGDDTNQDQNQSPQYDRSDTVAISRDKMQRILRQKHHQANNLEVSAKNAQDDSQQVLNKLSKSDHAKTTLSSDGGFEKAMFVKQPHEEAQTGSNTISTDREITSEDQKTPYNTGDTVAIPHEQIEKMIGSFHGRNETHNASAATTTTPDEDTERSTAKLTDNVAPAQPLQKEASDYLIHADATKSASEGQAQYGRGDTVAIPHEEIERMVRLAQREDKVSNPPSRAISGNVDEDITNVTKHGHERDNTDELWLDQINEKAMSSQSTQNESLVIPSDTSLNSDQAEIETPHSPSSTSAQQEQLQRDIEPTSPVSTSTDEIDKTVIIPRGRSKVNLASKRHQVTTHEEDEKTKERPFHSDK